MPSTQNAVNNHEYRSVPITALAESATNPRKRFDPKSLEELAAYVTGHISGGFVSLVILWPKLAVGRNNSVGPLNRGLEDFGLSTRSILQCCTVAILWPEQP